MNNLYEYEINRTINKIKFHKKKQKTKNAWKEPFLIL